MCGPWRNGSPDQPFDIVRVRHARLGARLGAGETACGKAASHRIVEAETVLPDTDDDDDADKPEQQPQPQAAPATPPKPVEDVQLKKAFELVKQAPAKGAAAQKHAAAKAPAAIGSAYDDRMAT